MNCTSRLIFCLSLLLSVAAVAQKPATRHKTAAVSSPDKLIALKATGTTRYTDKEILAACGLQIGQNAADGDFREAAKRLGDSGLFSDVAYTYTSSGSGVKLELQLTDVDKDKLVPANFENFPWFTNAELLDELQRRVPLFKRELPLAGKLPDHVEEALQMMLSEKKVPGRVDYLRETTQEGGKLTGIAYSVESLDIVIRNVEFPGAAPDLLAGLQTASHRLAGAPYRRSSLAVIADVDFLPVCLKSGYLKASFAKADARVVTQTDSEVEVDAIVPVTPGQVYATSGVEWKGNAAISTAEVSPLLHLPAGQPVDAVRLLHDIEGVGKLYRSRGYMVAQIKPVPQFDDAKSTVHYDLIVAEGDQYKMGELEILGLDTQSKAKMEAAWTLRQGQPYNADYLKQFLSETGSLLPRGVRWSTGTHATPDAKDKTVDVEIHFKQQ